MLPEGFIQTRMVSLNYQVLRTTYNQRKNHRLSGWNTEKVKDMSFMFENCYSLNELDLSSFDTHHVEDMVNMFYDCESLTKLTINNFDMSNVHNAYDMLTGSGLTRAFEKEEEKYIDAMPLHKLIL
mgnify:CR=1 FL=1